MKKKNILNRFSLKKRLILLIIFCWVIPLVSMLLFINKSFKFQIHEQMQSTMLSSVEGGLDILNIALLDIIESSKKITYDQEIEMIYEYYIKEEIKHLKPGLPEVEIEKMFISFLNKQIDEEVETINRKDLNYSASVRLYENTKRYLIKEYRYNNYFLDVLLFYSSNLDYCHYTSNLLSKGGYERIRKYEEEVHDKVLELSSSIGTETAFLNHENSLYMVRNIVTSSYDPYAIVVMNINTQNLFNSILNIGWLENAVITIEDANVPFPEKDFVALDMALDMELDTTNKLQSNTIMTENNGIYDLSITREIASYPMNFQLRLDASSFGKSLSDVEKFMVTLMLLVGPLIVLIIYLFYRSFSTPLNHLVDAAFKIQGGNLGYQISHLPNSSEFYSLTHCFNAMSTSMKEQFEQIYREQEALQSARIKALQSQINPHFLNNTLEVINWEMRLGENERAISMLESLSKMLNTSMARKGNSIVTIQEELDYVDVYLHIISIRMGERLSISREINFEVTHYKVPLLILQPMVENAIEHGIFFERKGKLIIRVYENQEDVIIEIENNTSLNEKAKAKIRNLLNWDGDSDIELKVGDVNGEKEEKMDYPSVGVRNVNQRLKLLFGYNYNLTIESPGENCTIAQIRVPKEQNKLK